MNQLSSAHLDWAASFLSIPADVLARGRTATTADRDTGSNGKLPSPMLPDCKTVHGKVPGPENHLLCATHNHVVDVKAKTIIAHSLAEYVKTHPSHHKSQGAQAEHAPPASATPANGAVAPATNDKLPSPMLPDCKTVRDKVPGPENHLLCTTHNHIVDVEAKTIIAHSLAEYMKTHPSHHKSHGAQTGHTPSATPANGATAPAQAPAQADVKPPEVPPTKIPPFTGSAKEVFAQECALLDTMKPSRENPEMYTAMVGGKEASIGKAQAEAILTQVSKQMENTITNIAQYNHSILEIYEQASAKGLEHIGSGLNKLVSFVKGDGWIHDPGDNLKALERQWLAALSGARGDLAQRHFQAAALKMADGEIKGLQAEHLFKVFESKTQQNANTTLSVLRQVESTSKSIAKTIATAEFGPAGAAMIDATFATAEVAGEKLAGHDVDWAGRVIDLGMDVLMDKFGDSAEAAVKDRVTGLLEDKLKRLGKEKAKELAEKIAEKVAKKVVEKGSDFVKEELHAAADAAKGKKMTYGDLAKATVDSMRKPNGEANSKLEAAIANDPEYAKLSETHAA